MNVATRPAPVINQQLSLTDQLLIEMRDEMRAIRGLLEQQQQRTPATLSRQDRDRLSRLLPAIAAVLGSELVSSAELLEHDSPALRIVCEGLSAKQLGRLLRRADGTPIGGYIVERQGSEAGACLWRVLAVPGFSDNEKVSVPHAVDRRRV